MEKAIICLMVSLGILAIVLILLSIQYKDFYERENIRICGRLVRIGDEETIEDCIKNMEKMNW